MSGSARRRAVVIGGKIVGPSSAFQAGQRPAHGARPLGFDDGPFGVAVNVEDDIAPAPRLPSVTTMPCQPFSGLGVMGVVT